MLTENNFLGELWEDITKEYQTGEIKKTEDSQIMASKIFNFLRTSQSQKQFIDTSNIDSYCRPGLEFQHQIEALALTTDFDSPDVSYDLEQVVTVYPELVQAAKDYVEQLKVEAFAAESSLGKSPDKIVATDNKRSELHTIFVHILSSFVKSLDRLPEAQTDLRASFNVLIKKLNLLDVPLEKMVWALNFLVNCEGTTEYKKLAETIKEQKLAIYNQARQESNQPTLSQHEVDQTITASHELALIMTYTNLDHN